MKTKKIRAWCVTWRSPRMKAPAFYYFRSRPLAFANYRYFMARGYPTATIRFRWVWVPETTPFLG